MREREQAYEIKEREKDAKRYERREGKNASLGEKEREIDTRGGKRASLRRLPRPSFPLSSFSLTWNSPYPVPGSPESRLFPL